VSSVVNSCGFRSSPLLSNYIRYGRTPERERKNRALSFSAVLRIILSHGILLQTAKRNREVIMDAQQTKSSIVTLPIAAGLTAPHVILKYADSLSVGG
jgi:hypothetical protein